MSVTAQRILGLLVALLAGVLLPACEDVEDDAPLTDPAYDEAVRLMRGLESETLDSEYQDPRFDAVLVALERIPVDSPRWSAAQERISEIGQARKKAEARRAEVAQMVDALRARPGAPAVGGAAQTPEDLHRKLVASLNSGKAVRERAGRGTYMPTRDQRLQQARARVTTVEYYIRSLEDGLRRICGGVTPSAQPGSQRERSDCVARRRRLEKVERQLEEARKELDLLEWR